MARVAKALATAKKPRFLIIDRETDEVVHAVTYKGKSPRQAQRIHQGLSKQMNTKKYRIKDDP
jgi:hypothetical protein